MTEKRNQRELLWIQTGGTLNFITAAPHCGGSLQCEIRIVNKATQQHQQWKDMYA
jgi:hypothetical protein